MKKYLFPVLSLAPLALLVIVDRQHAYASIGIVYMLLIPFVDPRWSARISLGDFRSWLMAAMVLALLILASLNRDAINLILATTLFAAIPEEWYFRGYLLRRFKKLAGNRWVANGLVSALFAGFHVPTQGWFGLTVFFPSLVYGWLYYRTGNVLICIGLHALSNVVYLIYLQDLLAHF